MSSIQLFATVFGVIFVAELPDKTALAAVVLATRHRALPVLLGTCSALLVQSIIAVAAGSLVAKLPARYVHIGTGVVFIACGIWMWLRHEEESRGDDAKLDGKTFWGSFTTVFGIVFVAEWGDLTQIGTAAFAAKYHAWLVVLCASTLALWSVAAIAVLVGNRAAKVLDPKRLQKVAAVVFVVIGVLLATGVV